MDSWKIGNIRVTRILEMSDPLRTAAEWFPDSTDEAIRPHLHWLVPRSPSPVTRQLIIPIPCYLGPTPRPTTLLHWFVGNNKTCEDFPPWHDRNDNTFLEQMTRAGVAPEQVDFVLCTHLHVDHCGWNTRLVNGRWVPTFPNARYIMARRELQAAEAGRNDSGDRT